MTSRERRTPKLNHSEIPKSTVGFIIMGKQYGSRCWNHTHNCWNSSSRASRGRKESHVCFSILFLCISLRRRELSRSFPDFPLGATGQIWATSRTLSQWARWWNYHDWLMTWNTAERGVVQSHPPTHTHTHTHTHTPAHNSMHSIQM